MATEPKPVDQPPHWLFTGRLVGVAWAATFLLPPVGLLLGIVLLGQRRIWHGLAIIVVSLVLTLAFVAFLNLGNINFSGGMP